MRRDYDGAVMMGIRIFVCTALAGTILLADDVCACSHDDRASGHDHTQSSHGHGDCHHEQDQQGSKNHICECVSLQPGVVGAPFVPKAPGQFQEPLISARSSIEIVSSTVAHILRPRTDPPPPLSPLARSSVLII